MSGLARLQLIGPAILLAAIVGAEGAAMALNSAPSSEFLWYLHSNVFGLLRRSEDLLSARIDIAHLQLWFVGLPLFLIACGGFLLTRPLLLAVASNLSFVYVSFVLFAGYAHPPTQTASLVVISAVIEPDAITHLVFFGGALLSFAVSHILYIRDICNDDG